MMAARQTRIRGRDVTAALSGVQSDRSNQLVFDFLSSAGDNKGVESLAAEAEELHDMPRDTPSLPAALVERFGDLSDRIAISPCNRDETPNRPKKAGSWNVSRYMSGIRLLAVPSGFLYSGNRGQWPVAKRVRSGRKPGPLKRGTVPMAEVGSCFIGALQEVEQHCIG
jgi:hypothetical protein